MPFEHIAGPVATLQLPSEPQFTSYKIERPIFPTADIVKQSVDSINEILKSMSPQAKLERNINMLQLQARQRLFQDYMANPKAYQLGPNGMPVPRDTLKFLNEAALLKSRTNNIAKQDQELKNMNYRNNFFDVLDNVTAQKEQPIPPEDVPAPPPLDDMSQPIDTPPPQ